MNTRCGLALALVLVVSAPLIAGAQSAIPLQDIDRGIPGIGASSAPRDLTVVGGKLFFTAEEPSSGRELWVSDGTAAGTEMLADICPGPCSPALWLRGSLGRLLVFTDEYGRVWRSDGTRAGTFALNEIGAEALVFLGHAAFFPICRDGACQLWTTDGTLAGTRPVADFRLDEASSFVGFSSGGKLFWIQYLGYPHDLQFWVSDGTAAGTTPLVTLPYSAGVRALTAVGGRLFFLAEGEQGEELWASDGTAAGTKPITHFASPTPFAATIALKAGASGVYFAADDGVHGVEIWTSNGTAAGTVRVTALAPDQPFLPQLDPAQIEEVGGRLVVITFDPVAGYRLVASRGTPSSTVSLGSMEVSPYAGLSKAGGRIYFRADDGNHGYELWSTDGTPAGTGMVRDICPGPCDSQLSIPQAISGGVAFLASDSVHGQQVWTSDGTAAGTRARTNLPPGSLFAPGFEVAAAGSRLFFPATDGHGEELWTSGPDARDGQLVEDVARTARSSEPREMTAVGERLVFTACDGTSRELWGSDGTVENTFRLSDFRDPQSCSDDDYKLSLASDGGPAAFFLHEQRGIPWLWRTDGTPDGTEGIAINGASRLTVHDGVAFFSTSTDEIWRSDGTAAGTRKVLDLPADSGLLGMDWVGQSLYLRTFHGLHRSDGISPDLVLVSTAPQFSFAVPRFTQANGRLYFFAEGPQIYYPALWTSDGTPEGTHVVFAFSDMLKPIKMFEYRGQVCFLISSGSLELWASDGTPSGTVRLARFPDSSNYEDPGDLVLAAGKLFFTPDDGVHGHELWTSDGTSGGTVLLRDLYPGLTPSSPSSLTAFAGKLYFAAADAVHGRELWVSDGSAAGTHLAQDVAPEGLSSSPDELTAVGHNLFFTADDGITGRELWVLPADGAGCQPAAGRLCLGDGRFAVTAVWRDFNGNTGTGQAIPLTADTGGFWFFAPSNLELAVKVLDGRALNNAFWVFYGALSNVEYEITVTDTQTGLTRRYQNPLGQLASAGDTNGFGPLGAYSVNPPTSLEADAAARVAAAGSCVPGPQRLCLNGGRFAVEAAWKDFAGNTGTGTAVPLTGDTGTFWFFGPTNLEVFTKVLDGRTLNGKFWFFYGALSSVDYTLTVTDTQTGAVRVYHNPAGRLASGADTNAF